MSENKYVWLPHMIGAVPREASQTRISMYTIALEAWRRGITVSFHKEYEGGKSHIRYKLKHGDKIHDFTGSMGDLIKTEAVEICDDKSLTYKYLSKANVPVPEGKKFDGANSNQDIIKYAKQLGYPLVLKPTNGSGGKGVFANIKSEDELINAIDSVRDKLNYQDVILQQYISGKEVRVYVFKDKVLGAIQRIPANIIGDGKQTIRQLINEKNEFRKTIPHLYYRPIKLNAELFAALKKMNYTLESIPPKDKRVFLREISNVSTGGDPIDFIDHLSDHLKDMAIKATRSVPGLPHCGLDMIIDEENNNGVIIELNTRPGLGSHLFPLEGVAVDIPKAIIDYYFPETIEKHKDNSNAYFNLKSVITSLNQESIDELEVINCPKQKLTSKRALIEVSGRSQKIFYTTQRYTRTRDVHGYLSKIAENKFELVIASTTKTDLSACFDDITKELGKKIKSIELSPYLKPIQIGFELKDNLKFKSTKLLEFEIEQLSNEMNLFKKEIDRLNKRMAKIKKGIATKLTTPLKLFMK